MNVFLFQDMSYRGRGRTLRFRNDRYYDYYDDWNDRRYVRGGSGRGRSDRPWGRARSTSNTRDRSPVDQGTERDHQRFNYNRPSRSRGRWARRLFRGFNKDRKTTPDCASSSTEDSATGDRTKHVANVDHIKPSTKDPDNMSGAISKDPLTTSEYDGCEMSKNKMTSIDPKFTEVWTTMYKYVQLQHHIETWENKLTETLESQFFRVMNNNKPDINDKQATEGYRAMANDFAEQYRQSVTNNMQRQSLSMEDKLATLQPYKLNDAKQVTNKHISNTLKSLPTSDREILVQRAANMVGSKIEQPPNLGEQSTTNSIGTNRTTIRDDIINRMTRLTVRLDARDADTPGTKTTSKDGNNIGLTFVETADKMSWRIPHDVDDIRVLVLGDSNMRRVTKIPTGMMVCGMAGARMEHVINTVQQADLRNPVKLVVQVGINNRTDSLEKKNKLLDKLVESTGCNLSFTSLHVLGIAIPSTFDRDLVQQAQDWNDCVLDSVGKSSFIPPMEVESSSMTNNNIRNIHYNGDTANGLLTHIMEHLTVSANLPHLDA